MVRHLIEVSPPTSTCSAEYRSDISKQPPVIDGITTLYELWQRSAKQHGDRPCLGLRSSVKGEPGPYEFQTYADVDKDIASLGSALAAVGVTPKQRVGVYGANSPEWMKAMQACNRQSLWCVPLYDTLGENAVTYIIKHAECSTAFVSSTKAGTLIAALPELKTLLKTVVVWGSASAARVQEMKDIGVQGYTFEEFIKLGSSKPSAAIPPSPSDLSTIMYTSGTTGEPKGVMIKHSAVVATIASGLAFLRASPDLKDMGPNDVYLSYLPLAHIFDRVSEELVLSMGGSIGYWRGDITGLVDDIGALRPTFFIGVPRVFERIHAGITEKIAAAGCLKQTLFAWGFSSKLASLRKGIHYKKAAPFWDALLFKKVKERLGGRVKVIISGGAPLPQHVEDFLRVTMCCAVIQGYGLTETCAASFIAVPGDMAHSGTVGPPQPVVNTRLESVPELNYLASSDPPRGEVLISGPCLFSGYYKREAETKEVLTEDGWFHTGDIGEITPSGGLRIIDRKKNIFKLSQGEYVAVEKLEETYKKSPVVEQVWVYGNSFESSLVAIIVPKAAALQTWAKSAGKTGDFAQLCKVPEACEWVLEALVKEAKADKFKGFETVRAVALEPNPWTPPDLLTPTFKLKRPVMLKHYQSVVDGLYASIKKGR